MSIRVECDVCGARFRVAKRYAGEDLPCKNCGEYFSVPGPSPKRRNPPPRSRRTSRRPPSRSSRSSRSRSGAKPQWPLPVTVVAVVLVTCGIFLWTIASRNSDSDSNPDSVANETQGGNGSELFPVAEVPLPAFPQQLPAPIRRDASGATIHYVDLKSIPGNSATPGSRMSMRIYLPPGEHEAGSLGCVLVAPAGSNMLRGNPMDPDDYHEETLPYVKAGFAVVFYSIDGILHNPDSASNAQFARAYEEFKAAHAGVVNGRNALEFVLAKMPAVDPNRIYSAGHSSAGVLSLLLAEHEPRLKGCIAYAPATDVELRLGEFLENPQITNLLPDLETFLKQSSPKTHAKHLECPVFLFHAEDDSNEPIATTRAFAEQLKREGKQYLFRPTPTGDHYRSMIDPGIPWAIEWLKTLPTERGKSYPKPKSPEPIAQKTDTPRTPGIQPPTMRPPTFRPPSFEPPTRPFPRRPVRPGSKRVMTFQLLAYSGSGDATETARRVLRRYPWCVAESAKVDFDAKQLVIEVRGGIINSGPVKSGLQREGFQLGGVSIRSQ